MRNRKDKKAKKEENAPAQAPIEEAAAHDPQQLEENDDADAAAAVEPNVIEPRNMTKKELQRELKRQEREEMRRFEEQRREEQRKRMDVKQEAYEKKREEEERAEQEREEAERKALEEKAKKEREEFDKWKDMFTVEEQGSKADADSEESQSLLQQFVDYIKARKVVLLEDLGAAFNLPTQEAIQRVEALQQSNRITGIIDDRGKFIYITEEEMDKVAKFIQRKGRLGLAELSKECNKLIRLDGEKEASGIATASVDWLMEAEETEPVAVA